MGRREYKSFLLRLWRERAGQPWRAQLQDPITDKRFSFATFVELVEFMMAEVEIEVTFGPKHTPTCSLTSRPNQLNDLSQAEETYEDENC